jgi:hypothetical protein
MKLNIICCDIPFQGHYLTGNRNGEINGLKSEGIPLNIFKQSTAIWVGYSSSSCERSPEVSIRK